MPVCSALHDLVHCCIKICNALQTIFIFFERCIIRAPTVLEMKRRVSLTLVCVVTSSSHSWPLEGMLHAALCGNRVVIIIT